MNMLNIASCVSTAGVTAILTTTEKSPVWWIGLVMAVVGAVYSYIQNNKR